MSGPASRGTRPDERSTGCRVVEDSTLPTRPWSVTQVALVGFGRVRERAWTQDGVVTARPCVVATLSADHRVSDGMRGARYLSEIDRLLQEPEKL